jgi:hypothetical protein
MAKSNTQGTLLFEALKSKYESEIKSSVATLSIYFNNSVGIGEHPQQLEEMDKLTDQLVNAEDKLQGLMRFFNEDGSTKLSSDSIRTHIEELSKAS